MKDFMDELDRELDQMIPDQSGPSPIPKKNTPAVSGNKQKTSPNKNTAQSAPRPNKGPAKQHTQKTNTKKSPQNSKPKRADHKIGETQKSEGSKYGRKIIQFPETKFFLPTLREGYTRVIPIGGNNEIGAKNMNMIQYEDDILLIDCGVQFAEPDMLGADYSVPDVSFLTKYTKNIKGFLITHAHLDHIGALKNVLPVLDMPTLYGTKLTIGLIKKAIGEE